MESSYKQTYKKITVAKKTPDESQIRDQFQTPNYAIDLLLPFIPKHITHIWECAAGGRKISRKMENSGYTVLSSDIKEAEGVEKFNFISDGIRQGISPEYFSIITNPPFSIKNLFIERCFEYGVPFALLINADYSQQQIDWIRRGFEKIIPTSRIAYITPNILRRIHEGEVWRIIHLAVDYGSTQKEMEEYKQKYPSFWIRDLDTYPKYKFNSIEDTPQEYLYKYSNAQFHSMWLTYGFNLGRTETFVNLTADQRKNNI